jgi:hypothetical protein
MRTIHTLALLLALGSLGTLSCGKNHGATTGDGNGSNPGGGDGGSGSNGGGDGGTPAQPIIITCPSCPTFPPLGAGSGSVPACTGSAVDPQLVYPPDGVLLPPNMNVIEIQFMPGSGNSIFEIDFENSVSDVRIETPCNAITNTRGTPTGGCSFDLDAAEWNDIAMSNAGGGPVHVTVRGAPSTLSCVIGSNTRQILFASQPLSGGIYYWQSVTQGGVAGNTGGIFRKDFGDPSPTPEPFLTPGNLNKCVGCHYLSRDGLKMVFGDDDADSDDELGDDNFFTYDILAGSAGNMQLSTKGFAAWRGSGHDEFVVSDGVGQGMQPELVPFLGSNGQADGNAITFGSGSAFARCGGGPNAVCARITNPDWSADGSTLYFTLTTVITNITGSAGTYNNKDDIHATNGSIWSVSVSGSGAFGTPTEVVTPASALENDYYPAIAPDNATLIFDRALGSGSAVSGNASLATLDSYSNPGATLYAMSAAGGTPVALANTNFGPGLTNSWPRWSPAVQTYGTKHIAWITFSSTRDYGLRVQNDVNDSNGLPLSNCYPPVSPENPSGDHKEDFALNCGSGQDTYCSCTQPQLWMAAISLDDIAAGHDGSYPAFWLPFQDYTAHNHIAQWVDTIQMQTGCAQGGSSCSAATCCAGYVCGTETMTCDAIIP